MRRPSPWIVLAALLPLTGCPERKPAEPESRTVPQYERASEAVKARIPTGLPTDKAVKNIQQGLEAAEKSQDQHLRKASEAAAE